MNKIYHCSKDANTICEAASYGAIDIDCSKCIQQNKKRIEHYFEDDVTQTTNFTEQINGLFQIHLGKNSSKNNNF